MAFALNNCEHLAFACDEALGLPEEGIAPVSLLVLSPGILASSKAGVRSVKEFIELARAKPGQLTFSSAGAGSSGRLGMELLKTAVDINIINVPFD